MGSRDIDSCLEIRWLGTMSLTARCTKETVHSLLLSNGNLIRSLLKTARRSCAFSSMEDPRIA